MAGVRHLFDSDFYGLGAGGHQVSFWFIHLLEMARNFKLMDISRRLESWQEFKFFYLFILLLILDVV